MITMRFGEKFSRVICLETSYIYIDNTKLLGTFIIESEIIQLGTITGMNRDKVRH